MFFVQQNYYTIGSYLSYTNTSQLYNIFVLSVVDPKIKKLMVL